MLFDGVPGALFFVRQDQINVQASYSLDGKESVKIQVLYQGVPSRETEIAVVSSNPGLFMYGPRAIILDATLSLVTADNPASQGDIIIMFATGGGQTSPAGVDGKLATVPFPAPVLPVTLTIGGVDADVLFAAQAPGFAGLMQVNARIGAVSGVDLQIVLTVGPNQSQPGLVISVQ